MLFCCLLKSGERYVWAGLRDERPGAMFDHQIYFGPNAGWYDFAERTKKT